MRVQPSRDKPWIFTLVNTDRPQVVSEQQQKRQTGRDVIEPNNPPFFKFTQRRNAIKVPFIITLDIIETTFFEILTFLPLQEVSTSLLCSVFLSSSSAQVGALSPNRMTKPQFLSTNLSSSLPSPCSFPCNKLISTTKDSTCKQRPHPAQA